MESVSVGGAEAVVGVSAAVLFTFTVITVAVLAAVAARFGIPAACLGVLFVAAGVAAVADRAGRL